MSFRFHIACRPLFNKPSPALKPLLDDPELTLRKNIKMHEWSSRTTHTHVSHDSEDTTASDKLLNRDVVADVNDMIHLKMKYMGTPMMAERKHHVDNVVANPPKLNRWGLHRSLARRSKGPLRKAHRSWRIPWTTGCDARMTRHTQKLALSFITSFNKSYSICCTGKGWKVSWNAHRELVSALAVSLTKICGKLLFTNVIMAPIEAFTHRRSCEAVAAKLVSTDVRKHLNYFHDALDYHNYLLANIYYKFKYNDCVAKNVLS